MAATQKDALAAVMETYAKLKGRELDAATAEFYAGQIAGGKMSIGQLEVLLSGLAPPPAVAQAKEEKMADEEMIPVVIPANAMLSEERIVKLLMHSRLYTERVRPLVDVGQYVRENVAPEFWRVFYEENEKAGGKLDFDRFTKLLASYAALKEMKSG